MSNAGAAPLLRLDQSRLDISARSRTSRLPWRGQFSPELIEYLIDAVCPDSRTFLDPFCGSGTVLFEAVARGHSAWGCEVNAAAWHLANLAEFGCQRLEVKAAVVRRVRHYTAAVQTADDIFGPSSPARSILLEIREGQNHPMVSTALAACLILGMGNNPALTDECVARGAFAVLGVLNEMSDDKGKAKCQLSDARDIRLADESIEAVITSPPYINVFNYHQNFRPAVELLGWQPLQAARSEIGANRKHRMNRFLTVIQYCLDMAQALDETARLLAHNAPLVIVLGRTSNVLGAAFENSAIIKRLIELSGNFCPVQVAERVFTNRFGERIFEDILVASKQNARLTDREAARATGVAALEKIRGSVPEKNMYSLLSAIDGASQVKPSPRFQIATPSTFESRLA